MGGLKLGGGNIWNWSLEMKEKSGIRSLAVASQWMAAVISWWPLDGGCPLTHRILKMEGNIWYEVGLPNLSTSTLSLSKKFPPVVFYRRPAWTPWDGQGSSPQKAPEALGIGHPDKRLEAKMQATLGPRSDRCSKGHPTHRPSPPSPAPPKGCGVHCPQGHECAGTEQWKCAGAL